ncbi:hypothetical protein HMPREF1548_05500 [Clostridium sp. KLE 1755]|nr:hypothetical protein HMPREF1548_05500 [Clostridium sp. KLE 1755]
MILYHIFRKKIQLYNENYLKKLYFIIKIRKSILEKTPKLLLIPSILIPGQSSPPFLFFIFSFLLFRKVL